MSDDSTHYSDASMLVTAIVVTRTNSPVMRYCNAVITGPLIPDPSGSEINFQIGNPEIGSSTSTFGTYRYH